jgi:hypothetical protein
MRSVLFVVATVIAASTAAADPAPSYPISEVDRPLVLYAGMTTLDLGLDFPTYLHTTVEPDGTYSVSKTTLGHYTDADVVLTHSFGTVQIGGRILGNPSGPFAELRALTMLGPVPGALGLTADFKAPQPSSTIDYEYSQVLYYSYKVALVPHQLALDAAANVELTEAALKPDNGAAPAGTQIFSAIGVAVEAQIMPQLAINGAANLFVPLRTPEGLGTYFTSVAASTGLLYALGHWDFYAQLGISDVSHYRLPFLNVGAVHRWGG